MRIYQKALWFLKGTSSEARRARRIVKILFLLVLFIGLFWIIPVEKVITALLQADPLYLVFGIGLGFLSIFLTAVQMTVLVRKQNISLGVMKVLMINLAAKFYTLFAPGNIVASGIKWYRLSIPDGKPAEALAALGFFRLLETFLNVALGLSFWLLSGQDSIRINWEWPLVVILGTTLLWLILTRLSLPIYTWLKARGKRVFAKPSWQSTIKRLDKLILAITAFKHLSVWELFLAISAGIISLLAGVASSVLLASSLGIELSFIDMGWIYAVVILLSQMPFAIAGGLGVREISLVFMLSTFGIDPELAIAFSFLIFVRGVVISLAGGLFEAIHALRQKQYTDLDGIQENLKEI